MTPYNVAVTTYEQEVLEWMVRQINSEKGTSLTVAQFLQIRLPELIAPFALRYEEAMAEAVRKRYPAANTDTKSEVRRLLGVDQ